MRKILNILFAFSSLFIIFQLGSCKKKKKDTPVLALIFNGAPNGDSVILNNSFPKINIVVKNTGDLNAYTVQCSATAYRQGKVIDSDAEPITVTYMKPNEIDTDQIWFNHLKSY